MSMGGLVRMGRRLRQSRYWEPPSVWLKFPDANPEEVQKHAGNALKADSQVLALVRLEVHIRITVPPLYGWNPFDKCFGNAFSGVVFKGVILKPQLAYSCVFTSRRVGGLGA